jgi:hypothetical protein
MPCLRPPALVVACALRSEVLSHRGSSNRSTRWVSLNTYEGSDQPDRSLGEERCRTTVEI